MFACRPPPAVPPLPSKGGPPWVEASSAHFTVWTDAPDRAKGLVQTMERLREVVFATALFSRVSQPSWTSAIPPRPNSWPTS